MSSLTESFEAELKKKLSQKATVHVPEENVLLKSFKYFDYNKTGLVTKSEFVKTLEKIGVFVESPEYINQLFEFYDLDGDGKINYKEFSSIVFGNLSGNTRKLSPKKLIVYKDDNEELSLEAVEKFKANIYNAGLLGLLDIIFFFKMIHDEKKGKIQFVDFYQVCQKFHISLNESDLQRVFKILAGREDFVTIDSILFAVRPELNPFRRSLVLQTYEKLKGNRTGTVDTNILKKQYTPNLHPNVKANKEKAEKNFNDFDQSVNNFCELKGIRNSLLTLDEFIEFFAYAGAVLYEDELFRQFMLCFKIIDQINSKNIGIYLPETYSIHKAPLNPTTQNPFIEKNSREFDHNNKQVYLILDKIRAKLIARGVRTFFGIYRHLKSMDLDNDGELNYYEFSKALHDYRIELLETELQFIFRGLEKKGTEHIILEEFLFRLTGPLNEGRKKLVEEVFKKTDRDNRGIIDFEDIKAAYSTRNHPDLKNNKRRTEDEIFSEFFECLDNFHTTIGANTLDITLQEFENFFRFFGATIEDDRYFEAILQNCFKLLPDLAQSKVYAGGKGCMNYDPKKGWLQDHHRVMYSGGSVTSNAPFGTSSEKTDYTTSMRPKSEYSHRGLKHEISLSDRAAGTPTLNINNLQSYSSRNYYENLSDNEIVHLFRLKLKQRGIRGIFILASLFKEEDTNYSHEISLQNFIKVLNDFRFDFKEPDIAKIFRIFDRPNKGIINYHDFIYEIRGKLNPSRSGLVLRAFEKLDRLKTGNVNIDDIKRGFIAANHPDLRYGKKTEDDVRAEFVETFDANHIFFTGDEKLQEKTIKIEEFFDYYTNLGFWLEDDKYFEAILKSCWNLDNTYYEINAPKTFNRKAYY